MRKALIYYGDAVAGTLTETDDGDYVFSYSDEYIKAYPNQPITLTMPVTNKEFKDNRLFAFFEGLIPEGWLLEVATKNWKINPNDRMGLLLACCKNCIGAVSVIPIPEDYE